MDSVRYHHAIKVNLDKCVSCTHCIKVCPTEAIRVIKGKAVINKDRCVDCGECLRACPVNAFYVEQDDLLQIQKYKHRVALFPAAMIGQFPENITENQIYNGLLQIGFTHAHEVEQPISVLKEMVDEYCQQHSESKPLISSYCPAVIRLIQVRYPSMTENIIRLKAPHDLAALNVKQALLEDGAKEEEIGIFYITPCAAKIAAVKQPVGEEESIINGIINMNEVYNRIMLNIENNKEEQDTSHMRQGLTRDGVLWCLTDGEAIHSEGRAMAIDGIHNVIKFFERIENEETPEIDFLEVRACDQSCAGGILLTGNRFLTVERLRKRALRYQPATSSNKIDAKLDIATLKQSLHAAPIPPKPIMMLDKDMARALEKLNRARSIMCHLPGIDCGACGAPSCMALAEDMVQQKAKMSDCIFLQQRWQSQGKISAKKAYKNMEEKWGEDRFEPDCNKKGAKNESF
ncbi:4Fe-4S dicluster domain-containing protein [Puteibacter caeruleilacunae]|nr:4Fe-4S dicluster domain-containing protein [Puteibacter caeruleilacunae]